MGDVLEGEENSEVDLIMKMGDGCNWFAILASGSELLFNKH